jgi:monoamine oxidase
MTKLWIRATGVPDGMLGAGWGTPLHWLTAQQRDGDVQYVVAFAIEGALDVEDRDAIERALRAYAPEAVVHSWFTHDWNADPYSRGGWMCPPVGWETAGVLERLRRPHGRVLVAGSDVSEEFGGWIAGAVASGRSRAALALEALRAAPLAG